MVIASGLRVSVIVVKKFVKSPVSAFTIGQLGSTVVGAVVGKELLIVARLVVTFAVILPTAIIAVEGYEGVHEFLRRGMRLVIIERNVCIVQQIFVIDLFAIEYFLNVFLVLEVSICKFSFVHNG